jgi:predicted PurR-regulated permease PerM
MPDEEPEADDAESEAEAPELEPVEPTPSAREVPVEPGRVLVIVDWVSYAHLGLGLVALLALLGLFGSAVDSITKLVIGAVLALALDTPVRMLRERGLPRGAAATIVCLVLLGALTAVVAFLGPPALREAATFGEELPATLEEMYSFPLVGPRLEDADVAARTDEWLDELPGTITSDTVSEAAQRTISALVGVVQVMLVALALLLDGEVIVRRARATIPEHLRPRADEAGRLVYETLGRYFAGSLLLALLNGTYILAVGLVLGVPLIVLAAIWVAITNLIPQIGGFLGGSVFVTLALTQGAVTGVLAFAFFMAYMSAENYLIQPAVVGKAVNLSPPATMIAALVGGAALGVPGALIATPLVGSVKALYLAARRRDDLDDAADLDHRDDLDDAEPSPSTAPATPTA